LISSRRYTLHMSQKWNLQDIRPTEPRRKSSPELSRSHTLRADRSETTREETQSRPLVNRDRIAGEEAGSIVIKNGNKESNKSLFIAGGIVAVLIVGVVALSALLSKTTLTVYPENRTITVNAEFLAYPERREGMLSYGVVTLTEEGDTQVEASGQEMVVEQAKGYIEIIKTTPGSERLIKNTRFRSSEGLVFRIQESVVVPGALRDTSGSLIPGTIRAEVFADAAGPEYNLNAGTRFDVPGFQESGLNELYNSIYAENREAFSGGFNGPRFIIADADLDTAKQRIHIELRDKLLARIETERPAGSISFPGSVSFTYESLPAVRYGDNLVTMRERAVLQIPVFNELEFSGFIAKETIATYNRQQPVRITNIHDLVFTYIDQTMNARNIAGEPSIAMNITGRPHIVWLYDADKLRNDLAGKSFTALSLVLSAHPGITSARITGKPFWQRTFPESPEKLNVVEILEE